MGRELFSADRLSVGKVHSAYFESTQSKSDELMRRVLRGDDRTLIEEWVKNRV